MANAFYGLDMPWLVAELERWKTAHSALSQAHEYELRTGSTLTRLTRVDLPLVQNTMVQIRSEIDRQNNADRSRTFYLDRTNDWPA